MTPSLFHSEKEKMATNCPGGGWEGSADGDTIDGGLLEFIRNSGRNGIVINGVVTWLSMQMDGVAEEIWFNLAMAKFSDSEVCEAKTALLTACGKNFTETLPTRQGKNKRKSELEDIMKVLRFLRSADVMPLILASGYMMKRVPNSTGIPNNASNGDIVQSAVDEFRELGIKVADLGIFTSDDILKLNSINSSKNSELIRMQIQTLLKRHGKYYIDMKEICIQNPSQDELPTLVSSAFLFA